MWLLPFLGPFLSILLLLMLGLCTFNLLLKFISSRLEQFKKQIGAVLVLQEYQPKQGRVQAELIGTALQSCPVEAALEDRPSPIYPQLCKNNKKQSGMKGWGQLSDTPDYSWLSYPDSLDSSWLNWNSLPSCTIDTWRQIQWPVIRLTFLHLETAWPFT